MFNESTTKEAAIYSGDRLFTEWHWENWIVPRERMRLEHFLTPYVKSKLKMDYNFKRKT